LTVGRHRRRRHHDLDTKEFDMKATLTHPLRIVALVVVLAAGVVPTAPAQSETFIPGYTDFPNHLRVHSIFDEARKAQNG
jgi:hypothetical protein